MLVEPTPENRVSEFFVSYVLNSESQGRVIFADCACEDDPGCDELCSPICVTIESSDFSMICCDGSSPDNFEEIQECYEEQPKWINGLLRTYARGAGTSNFSVEPFHAYLNTKEILTESFLGLSLSEILPTIFNVYAGLNPDLYDIVSFEDCPITGPIQGDNFMNELSLLAQAGGAHLFTQVGGILTIEKWKDHTDPIEFVIPGELTISAQPVDYQFPNTTFIQATGSRIPTTECGRQVLTNNQAGPGPTTKCSVSGIKSSCTNISFNNLRGTREDILAGNYFSDNLCALDPKQDVEDGVFNQDVFLIDTEKPECVEICNDDTLTKGERLRRFREEKCFLSFTSEPTCTQNIVLSNRINQTETTQDRSDRTNNFGYGVRNFEDFLSYLRHSRGFPIPYSGFGAGAFGSTSFAVNNVDTDSQQSYGQCQTSARIVNGPLLCGEVGEQLENPYVTCKDQLFQIAVRRFQEILMAQNSWNVEVPYIPCLRVNQIVQFTVPETEECPLEVITGVINGISVDHKFDEGNNQSTTMKLSIADTACLEGIQYQSGNLFEAYCEGAGNQSGNINSSQVTFDEVSSVESGELYLYATGASGSAAGAYIEYCHNCKPPDPNCQYFWSFDYFSRSLSGTGTLPGSISLTHPTDFGVDTTIFGGPLLPEGTVSGTFRPLPGTAELCWNWSLILPPETTSVAIRNLRLTKVFTA